MNGSVTKFSLINEETGEIVPINIRVLGTSKTKGKFYKFMDAFTEDIILDKEIAGKAIKLLFWILKQLDYGETTFILEPKFAAEDLDITERTFYNWRKVLEKKGIIMRISGNLYTLNPESVMYGNVKKTENYKNVINKLKTAKVLKGGNDADR